MILLTPVWNSKVPEVQRKVALHVFGVEEGQCPPGTFWCVNSLDDASLHSLQRSLEWEQSYELLIVASSASINDNQLRPWLQG